MNDPTFLLFIDRSNVISPGCAANKAIPTHQVFREDGIKHFQPKLPCIVPTNRSIYGGSKQIKFISWCSRVEDEDFHDCPRASCGPKIKPSTFNFPRLTRGFMENPDGGYRKGIISVRNMLNIQARCGIRCFHFAPLMTHVSLKSRLVAPIRYS